MMKPFLFVLLCLVCIILCNTVKRIPIQSSSKSLCDLFPTDYPLEFSFECGHVKMGVFLNNLNSTIVKPQHFCAPQPYMSLYLIDNNKNLILCKLGNFTEPIQLFCEIVSSKIKKTVCDGLYKYDEIKISFPSNNVRSSKNSKSPHPNQIVNVNEKCQTNNNNNNTYYSIDFNGIYEIAPKIIFQAMVYASLLLLLLHIVKIVIHLLDRPIMKNVLGKIPLIKNLYVAAPNDDEEDTNKDGTNVTQT